MVYTWACLTPNRLWVSDMKKVQEIDEKGHLLRELDICFTLFGSHTLTKSGDLLFLKDNDVFMLTSKGEIRNLNISASLHFCIHSSRLTGDILIGDINIVTRYNNLGMKIDQIEFDNDGRSLYVKTICITENINEDIIVSDNGKNAIVAINKSRRHLFCYKGHRPRITFRPGGICTDMFGQILVCNVSENPNVHLLDQKGHFLAYLLTEYQHGSDCPQALCVDSEHNLYVGFCNDNEINVYRFIREKTIKDRKTTDAEIQKELPVFKKSEIRTEIKKLDKRSTQMGTLEKYERNVEELVENLPDYSPGQVWPGYPEILDDKIVSKYTNKFKTLLHPLTPNVPFLNIIMIGETGAGKSSFLRTLITALKNSKEDIKDIYRVSPGTGNEKSATQRIHSEPMYIGEKNQRLPCNLYDMPGLDEAGTIKKEELEKIINGQLKIDAEMPKDSKEDLVRKNPTLADRIHCILYVIHANSNLTSERTASIKFMKDIKDDSVRQFVIVTAIDEIGVPNNDMKNAYKYKCVRKFCEKVSKDFDVDPFHVIPVSNYVTEGTPNDAKNAMSLFSLWRVFNSTKEYIERQWNKK